MAPQLCPPAYRVGCNCVSLVLHFKANSGNLLRFATLGLALLVTFCWPSSPAAAPLEVRIDLSDQEMTVVENGVATHVWPVSTARPGKATPKGVFTVQSMKREHYSTLYDNAPMPFSIFFSGNYAIHGTTRTVPLDCVASASCVRLNPDDPETLFNLTLKAGIANTRIIIRE